MLLSIPGGAILKKDGLECPPDPGQPLTMGIRPEHVLKTDVPGDIEAQVKYAEDLGNVSYEFCELADGATITVETRGGENGSNRGMRHLSINPSNVFLFAENGTRIR